jgi:lipoprotein-anchoring transpeptidase ErfK/SrfK
MLGHCMGAVSGRLLPVLLILTSGFVVVAAGSAGAAALRTGHSTTAGEQALLVLHRNVVVRKAPNARAPAVAMVSARTPLTGSAMVLPVLQRALGPAGARWLRVRLPSRPNGATGWLPADAGSLSGTYWEIVVHRGARRAVVLENAAVRASFPVVVGKPSTPTPLGTFFVVEKLRLAAGVTEGPWALATSAYSDVLREYAGGPGEVALHGVVGFTAPLGTFSSHGCIRFANAAITWIAHHVGRGTPVVIKR